MGLGYSVEVSEAISGQLSVGIVKRGRGLPFSFSLCLQTRGSAIDGPTLHLEQSNQGDLPAGQDFEHLIAWVLLPVQHVTLNLECSALAAHVVHAVAEIAGHRLDGRSDGVAFLFTHKLLSWSNRGSSGPAVG